jgi:hypothetical protein
MLLRRAPDGAAPSSRPNEEEALRRLVLQQVTDYVSFASGPSGVRVMLSMTAA